MEKTFTICTGEFPRRRNNVFSHYHPGLLLFDVTDRPLRVTDGTLRECEELHFNNDEDEQHFVPVTVTRSHACNGVIKINQCKIGPESKILKHWNQALEAAHIIGRLAPAFTMASDPEAHNCRAGLIAAMQAGHMIFRKRAGPTMEWGTRANMFEMIADKIPPWPKGESLEALRLRKELLTAAMRLEK